MAAASRRSRSDVAAAALVLLSSAFVVICASAATGARITASPARAILHGSVHAHAAHARSARSLLDDGDLITAGLNMISGSSSSCGCRRLSLCDLATTLLQAIEANKAQDAETLRRRQQRQPDYAPYRRLLGRYRRAGGSHPDEDADDDSPPNPVLLHITRAYLRRVRDVEDAARREHGDSLLDHGLQDYQDDVDDDRFAEALRNLNGDSDPSDAIQRISRRHAQ